MLLYTRPQRMRARFAALSIAFIAVVTLGCSGGDLPGGQTATVPPAQTDGGASTPAPEASSQSATSDQAPEVGLELINRKWTGDLDGMIARRIIRVATTYNKTHYFIDRGVQRGAAYEAMKLFEEELNATQKTGNMRVQVVFVPMSREDLLTAVVEGRADLAAAALTVTPARQKLVDFSAPTRTDVDEVVVTGPGTQAIARLDDLAGREVFVRASSAYHEHLVALSAQFKARGLPAIVLKPAPETLEDDDILEMVNAGLVKIAVVDNYLAEFWKPLLPNLVLHPDVAVTRGGALGVAMRKDSPRLMAAANAWVRKHGPKTMFGNLMTQRYLKSTKFARNATSPAEIARFKQTVEYFQKYGKKYALDYVLMAAQGFQESGLDQRVKSPVGAIGVMQVMPATGKELAVGDVTVLEPNIHAGVKYIRFMIDNYFKNEPMDTLNKGLFAFASYNAGPNRVRQLRREAAERGLDPNVWFNNVERIASERIGRETVTYVSNIYKYYIAYSLAIDELEHRKETKQGS